MSYIPDTSTLYEVNAFTGEYREPKVINNYYEGILNKKDMDSVKDMRYIANDILDSFFNNLDIYEEEIMIGMGSIIPLNTSKLNLGADYNLIVNDDIELSEENLKDSNEITRILATLRTCLKDYIENTVNTDIVHMIDAMDEEEYRKNYEKICKRQEKLSRRLYNG